MAVSTGSGTKLSFRTYTGTTATTPSYTLLANVKTITPPKLSTDKVDATLLSGLQKQSTPGLPEYQGMFTVYTDQTDTAMQTIRGASKQFPVASFDWQILYPSGAMDQFSGYVSAIEPSELNVSDNKTIDITIEINTIPVFTAAPAGS